MREIYTNLILNDNPDIIPIYINLTGIMAVRGCEVVCICDEKNKIIGSRNENGREYKGDHTLITLPDNLDNNNNLILFT